MSHKIPMYTRNKRKQHREITHRDRVLSEAKYELLEDTQEKEIIKPKDVSVRDYMRHNL